MSLKVVERAKYWQICIMWTKLTMPESKSRNKVNDIVSSVFSYFQIDHYSFNSSVEKFKSQNMESLSKSHKMESVLKTKVETALSVNEHIVSVYTFIIQNYRGHINIKRREKYKFTSLI